MCTGDFMLGYMALKVDGTDKYGDKFELGKSYHVDGPIRARFGSKSDGFRFCTNVAETFRFIDSEDVKVAVVEATGQFDSSLDEYNDYEIYACSDLSLIKYLTREEIINLTLLEGRRSIEKLVKTYKVNEEERDILLNHVRGDNQMIGYVLYYCFGKEDIYNSGRNHFKKIVNEEYSKLDERLSKNNKIKKMI